LLGVHQGKAVYLLFNGVLGDKRPAGGNVLTHGVAAELPDHPDGKGPRVVYGEACRLGPKSLARYGITFRQVPYELKVD
jgi:adenine-specific DNA-methyltransferase